MSTHDICGRCEHFTLDGGRQSEGIGRCLGYGESNPEPLVRWDHPKTVLFGLDRDWERRDKREQWIAMRRREEGGDGPAACQNGP